MRYDLSGERPTQALVVPSAGGEPTLLFDGQAIHGAPAWSPDGTRLAAGTADGLIVTDGGGESASLLVPARGSAVVEVRWSPDGREIAYRLADAVWIVPLDGSGSPRRISPEGTYAGTMSWQPILAGLP
jgi:Tol biopolymer transport system component